MGQPNFIPANSWLITKGEGAVCWKAKLLLRGTLWAWKNELRGTLWKLIFALLIFFFFTPPQTWDLSHALVQAGWGITAWKAVLWGRNLGLLIKLSISQQPAFISKETTCVLGCISTGAASGWGRRLPTALVTLGTATEIPCLLLEKTRLLQGSLTQLILLL